MVSDLTLLGVLRVLRVWSFGGKGVCHTWSYSHMYLGTHTQPTGVVCVTQQPTTALAHTIP